MSKWFSVLWWVIQNAPELWSLIKKIIDLLEEAGQADKPIASMVVEAHVKGRKPATIKGTIRADLN